MPKEADGLRDYLSHLEEGYGDRSARRKNPPKRLAGYSSTKSSADKSSSEEGLSIRGRGGAAAGRHGAAVEDVQVPPAICLGSAKMGSVPADLDEMDEDSNLAGTEPTAGMAIDIRDPDYIWSSASIVEVNEEEDGGDDEDNGDNKGKKKKSIQVRYDGWGPEWDETIHWPNIRVARLFTYTKRVKCLVDLISKKKATKTKRGSEASTHCSLWPCTVSFRMPHPIHRDRAEELLRVEPNVFVQPYGRDRGMLPGYVMSLLKNGGRWMKSGRLRLWRDGFEGLGILPNKFAEAHGLGMRDEMTRGVLPKQFVETGSLLNEVYRVFELGGTPVEGRMFTGEIAASKGMKLRRDCLSSSSSCSSVVVVRDCTDAGRNRSGCSRSEDKCGSSDQDKSFQPKSVKYEPPPKIPKPIRLTEPLYPSGGVSRFKKSKKWGASVSLGGNELFLGSFQTQTQANVATEMALEDSDGRVTARREGFDNGGKSDGDTGKMMTVPANEKLARAADLKAVKLEESIAAVEKEWTPEKNFSLHEWTMQQIRHRNYLREKGEEEMKAMLVKKALEEYRGCSASDITGAAPQQQQQQKKSGDARAASPPLQRRGKKRKQSAPRRVDRNQFVYL